MRPKHQRSTRASNRGAKDDLGPNVVAHNGIEAATSEYLLQTASGSPYRNRIADPHLAEVVEWDALADQLPLKPASEAEGELRHHLRTQVTIPRQRDQKRFYASIQITGINMQDAHQITWGMTVICIQIAGPRIGVQRCDSRGFIDAESSKGRP
jgi:hypothetical protein